MRCKWCGGGIRHSYERLNGEPVAPYMHTSGEYDGYYNCVIDGVMREAEPEEEEVGPSNRELFVKEEGLTKYILRVNRHNCMTGHWYGPDPEPMKAGSDCSCAGCEVRRLIMDKEQ